MVCERFRAQFSVYQQGERTFDDQSLIFRICIQRRRWRELLPWAMESGDYLNNGRVDVLVTDFSDDYKLCIETMRRQLYPKRLSAGIASNLAVPFVGWELPLFDYATTDGRMR